MGNIKVTKGSMGAGKSARAIIEIDNHRLSNLKVYVIKPEQDTRDGVFIRSRAVNQDLEIRADLIIGENDDLPVDRLIEEEYDYIIVDEYHMVSAKVIKQLNYIASKCKTNISLYGLAISASGEPFEAAKYALAYADEIELVTSENKQGKRKMYHVRYLDGEIANIKNMNAIEAGDVDGKEGTQSEVTYDTVSREEFYTIHGAHFRRLWGLK